MTLVRINPWKNFERAARRINEFAGELEKGISFEVGGGFSPKSDIIEDEKNYYLHIELPGMSKEDVKISVNEERVMTIKGEKRPHPDRENHSFLRTERVFGSFSRAFVLPENLDIEKISAKCNDGVLELSLPKVEPPAPKEIEINIV